MFSEEERMDHNKKLVSDISKKTIQSYKQKEK